MKNLRKTRNTLSLLLAFALLAGILPQSGGVRHSATATDGLPNRIAIAIAAGENHSVAIDGEGSLWAWGRNNNGRLGDGSFIDKSEPTAIAVHDSPDTRFVSVGAGWGHSAAIDTTGGIWTWGANAEGQLGNSTTIGRNTPVRVGNNAASLAVGDRHNLVLRTDG
jgi:alpha-tubulin suppressor-like RCC1 family protein